MAELTHFDETGASRMVDISAKPVTVRLARASGQMTMRPDTVRQLQRQEIKKGDVLEVARLAGIMAAKRTAELIPLCHGLSLSAVEVRFAVISNTTLSIEALVRTCDRTGVEMEALTAVSVAALTVYDMCKSIDRSMTIDRIQLEEKEGGESGRFERGVHESAPQ